MRKLFEPDFDRRPLNKIEAALEPHETSWVDFMHGARFRRRYVRAEGRSGMRGFDLLEVHYLLESHRRRFDAGDRSAAFAAIVRCAEENVPLPYWLGDAILDMARRVGQESISLHDLFGLEDKLPPGGGRYAKRATKARSDLKLRGQLWVAVKEIMRKNSVSLDDAIKQARAKLRFPYQQSKARALYEKQEQIQREYLEASKGLARHHAPK